jgi:hypothetical protein
MIHRLRPRTGALLAITSMLLAVAPASGVAAQPDVRARADVPSVIFQALFGGNALTLPQTIAVDRHGNSYVAGFTGATDFPTTPGAFQPWDPPGQDAFVVKLDPSGRILYATYLGGAGSEAALGIAVDARGQAYVTGITDSADFPVRDAVQPSYGGGTDAFVAVLDADGGDLIYSTYIGGSGADDAADLALDGTGRVYVGGSTSSMDFPSLPGSAGLSGTQDGFVAVLAPRGTGLEASRLIGGSGRDAITDIAVAHPGGIYITGTTESIDFPTLDAVQATLAGGQDAFVTVLDRSLEPRFSTYLGGANNEFAPSIAVDRRGDAYVAGKTGAAGFPLRRPLQRVPGTLGDFFVTKIDIRRTTLVYSTYLGGFDAEDDIDIAVDVHGRVYLAGTTESPDFPEVNPIAGAASSVFVSVISRGGGRLLYSTRLPSVPGDENLFQTGSGVAVGSHGRVYVTGWGTVGFATLIEERPE